MKKLLFFTLIVICTNEIIAQNAGIGTVTPNASALKDSQSRSGALRDL